MADNVDITPGTGATIATDDVSGVHYQGVKIFYGEPNEASYVAWTDPLPVASNAERYSLVKKTVDFTASATAQPIWDPTSGTSFVIIQAIVSFSTAGALTVFDSVTDNAANRIFKLNGAANGGMAVSFVMPISSAAADNILSYTTDTAVGSLTVFGYEV